VRRTRKENIISHAITIVSIAGLLSIYGYLVHEIKVTTDEVKALQVIVDELKAGNAQLEVENARLFMDFNQEAEWLQECQLNIQSFDAEDKLTVESVNQILKVKK